MGAYLIQQFDQAKLILTSNLSRMQTTEEIANYEVSEIAEKTRGFIILNDIGIEFFIDDC
jgi:hypothetical protein